MDMERTTQRMRNMRGMRNVRNMIGTERARQMQNLPTKGVRIVPSDVFLWAAGASILVSLGLKLAGRKNDALFIGEWPPTLVALGVMSRLVGR